MNNQNEYTSSSHFSLTNTEISIINRISIGSGPTEIIYNVNTTYIYVLGNYSHDVYVINSGSNVISTSIHLGITCSQLAYDMANSNLYASNSNGNFIITINTLTNSISDNISTGIYSDDRGLFYNSYNQLLYIEATKQNDLLALNTTTKAIVAAIPINNGFGNGKISMDLHHNMYIPNTFNTITIINSENNSIVKTLTVGTVPLTTLYDSYSGFIYISVANALNITNTSSKNFILVYDPISNRIIKNIGVFCRTRFFRKSWTADLKMR